jgi:hypothetical protein
MKLPPVLCAFLLVLLPSAPVVAQAADPLAPGEHEVEVRGVKIWYVVRGEGPVLLLQPGGAGGEGTRRPMSRLSGRWRQRIRSSTTTRAESGAPAVPRIPRSTRWMSTWRISRRCDGISVSKGSILQATATAGSWR